MAYRYYNTRGQRVTVYRPTTLVYMAWKRLLAKCLVA